MSGENHNGVVPPFVEEKDPFQTERGRLSMITMVIGFTALTLAMGGGVWLIWTILEKGLMDNLETAMAGIVPIGLAFLVGWIFCLLCIRAYDNLILPSLVRYYSWITLTGVLLLYIKVMQKLFTFNYGFPNFVAYNAILVAVLLALLGLHLIPEEDDLRPLSIPLIWAGLFQLWLMIVRYVLHPVAGKGKYVVADLWIFVFMQAIAVSMLAHTGVFDDLRRGIANFIARQRAKFL